MKLAAIPVCAPLLAIAVKFPLFSVMLLLMLILLSARSVTLSPEAKVPLTLRSRPALALNVPELFDVPKFRSLTSLISTLLADGIETLPTKSFH